MAGLGARPLGPTAAGRTGGRSLSGRIAAAGLVVALVAGGCSVILAQGPPRHGEKDHDPTGRYEGGVPCTSSWTLPVVDVAIMLLALRATVTADNRDDREDGALGAAAAAVSALIGYWRADDCREAQADAAAAGTPPSG